MSERIFLTNLRTSLSIFLADIFLQVVVEGAFTDTIHGIDMPFPDGTIGYTPLGVHLIDLIDLS